MFEDVRRISKSRTTGSSDVTSVTFVQIAKAIAEATGNDPIKPQGLQAKLQQSLQANLNEMFFTQRLILVEGLEDIAYITAYLHLANLWEEYRRYGCHMIAADGKDKIIQPLAIANAMGIRTLAIFDFDGDKYGLDGDAKVAEKRLLHIRDNKAILHLCGVADPAPFPLTSFFSDRVVMWHSEIGSIAEQDIGANEWQQFCAAAESELGQPGGLKKNGMCIAIALTNAWNAGKRSPHLERLCVHILQVAEPAPAIMNTADQSAQIPQLGQLRLGLESWVPLNR